jgi:uncharacterized cupredoxin-like copper-binding protein
VVANEYSLALSRLRVVGGPVIVQLVNFGEDAHDLRLRRDGGTRTYRIAATAPGEERELEARLRAGRFTLWCSLGNHRALGMEARLRVVNSAPPRKRAGQPAGG